MSAQKGTIKYACGAPKEMPHGPSINVLVTLEGGQEVRVYGKPGDAIQNLVQGQAVEVAPKQGSKYYAIVSSTPGTGAAPAAPAPTQGQAPKTLPAVPETPEQRKKKMLDYLASIAKLQRECYNAALSNYKDESEGLLISEQGVVASANTLFIQMARKFNL